MSKVINRGETREEAERIRKSELDTEKKITQNKYSVDVSFSMLLTKTLK